MRLSTVVAVIVGMLFVLVARCDPLYAGGFGFTTNPGMHEVYGRVNVWAQVIYPDAPKANFSIVGHSEQIVYDSNAEIRFYLTSDSGNWKTARIELPDGSEVKIPVNRSGNRDILYKDISLSRFLLGLNGAGAVIGQKASHKAIISLPILGNIGKRGIYNEDWGLIRFHLIQPTIPLDYVRPIPEFELSAKEVYLLTFCGGIPFIGSVQKELVRQIAEKQINLSFLKSQEVTELASVSPEKQIEPESEIGQIQPKPETVTTTATQADENSPKTVAIVEVETGKLEPEVVLTQLADTDSTHFSINLPIQTPFQYKFSDQDWQVTTLRNPDNLIIPTLQTTLHFQFQYWDGNQWVSVPDESGNTVIKIPGGE